MRDVAGFAARYQSMSSPVRQCHVCSQENTESAFFCLGCGADISRIVARVLTTDSPAKESSSPDAQPGKTKTPETIHEDPPVGGKECPQCGAENEAFLILCRQCGADIQAAEAGEPGVDKPAPATESKLMLEIGSESFECRDGDILGREGTVACQALAAIKTVSRRHISVSLVGGRWHATALAGVQNVTQLDGREMKRNIPQPLSGDHKLRMSTQCEARLRVVVGA